MHQYQQRLLVLLFASAISLIGEQSTFADEIDKAALKSQLVKHEGKRNKVYLDSEGIPTIGVGFNLHRSDAKQKIAAMGVDYEKLVSGDVSLTDEQVDSLLDDDIESAIADCKSVVGSFSMLSDVRKRVLVDMTFNLGKTRFGKFKKMLAAIEPKTSIKRPPK